MHWTQNEMQSGQPSHSRQGLRTILQKKNGTGIMFAALICLAMTALTGCRSELMEKLGWGSFGYNQGYSPTQPIAFDHSLHVGQNQIQCQYCHNQVERSKHSNIPALSTCMNCHLVIRNKPGTNEPSPEIAKLVDAYTEGKSIEWVKVHMLPDHAHFNHAAHLAKGVNCQTCHGPVETMKKVYQYSNLSMGWCVNCHRQPENKAPLNCSTCHH